LVFILYTTTVTPYHGSTALVGLRLLTIDVSKANSDKPHSVRYLWTRDRPVAETSTWQHTTITRDRHVYSG